MSVWLLILGAAFKSTYSDLPCGLCNLICRRFLVISEEICLPRNNSMDPIHSEWNAPFQHLGSRLSARRDVIVSKGSGALNTTGSSEKNQSYEGGSSLGKFSRLQAGACSRTVSTAFLNAQRHHVRYNYHELRCPARFSPRRRSGN